MAPGITKKNAQSVFCGDKYQMILFDHETYDFVNLQNTFRLKLVCLSKKRHSGRNTRTKAEILELMTISLYNNCLSIFHNSNAGGSGLSSTTFKSTIPSEAMYLQQSPTNW